MNHVSPSQFKQAHQTSARYPRDISEFAATGLKEDFKDEFVAPYVSGSAIQVGLKLVEIKDIEINNTHFVLGEILRIYIPESSVRKDGFVDLADVRTLALSGLDCYYTTERLTRLTYAKPNRPVQEMTLDGVPSESP